MGHVSYFPQIEEALAVCEKLWVPVDVEAFIVITECVEVHPKDSVVFCFQVVEAESLFELWGPASRIVDTKLPIVALMAPRVLDHKHFVSLELHNLKDSISMATDKPNFVFVINCSCSTSDQAITIFVTS